MFVHEISVRAMTVQRTQKFFIIFAKNDLVSDWWDFHSYVLVVIADLFNGSGFNFNAVSFLKGAGSTANESIITHSSLGDCVFMTPSDSGAFSFNMNVDWTPVVEFDKIVGSANLLDFALWCVKIVEIRWNWDYASSGALINLQNAAALRSECNVSRMCQ